jgi:hypothetical protein
LRTWIATDACGNSSSKSQTVTVVDTTAPVLSAAPADTTVECDSVPPQATLTATDNCDPSPTVTPVESSTQVSDPANVGHYNYTITRTWTTKDSCGNSSSKSQTITVQDTTAPALICPVNISTPCSVAPPTAISFAATATDNCDPSPTVVYKIGSTPITSPYVFPIGTTTVTCTATDHAGNIATCSFTVTQGAALTFNGFLPPIGGADGTGGTFADPIRAFKLGSTIPIKFQISCGGSPVSTGIHTLQCTKYSSAVDSDPAIDATPTDSATTGNQFRLTDATSGEWHFNLSTKPLSQGTWQLVATLSDTSVHTVWITIKK